MDIHKALVWAAVIIFSLAFWGLVALAVFGRSSGYDGGLEVS